MKGNPIVFTAVLLVLLAIYIYFEKKRRSTEDRYIDSMGNGPNPLLDMDEVFAVLSKERGEEGIEAVETYSAGDFFSLRSQLNSAGIKNRAANPEDSSDRAGGEEGRRILIFKKDYEAAKDIVSAYISRGGQSSGKQGRGISEDPDAPDIFPGIRGRRAHPAKPPIMLPPA